MKPFWYWGCTAYILMLSGRHCCNSFRHCRIPWATSRWKSPKKSGPTYAPSLHRIQITACCQRWNHQLFVFVVSLFEHLDKSWIFGHKMNGNQSKINFTWIQFDSNPFDGSNMSTVNQFPVDVPSWDDENSLGVGDGVGAILLEVIGCPLSPVDASNKANSPLVLKNYIREQQRIDTITHYWS